MEEVFEEEMIESVAIEYDYNQRIEYIDGTNDKNFDNARLWAIEHNTTFIEDIDARLEEDGVLHRFFDIGIKKEEDVEEEKDRKRLERIYFLKQQLLDTDYIYNVIREGDATEEHYSNVIELRKQWRAEVRRLENTNDSEDWQ